MTRTPARSHQCAIVPATSLALSDTGNTRFPRSVLSFSPCDSESSIVCVGDRRFSAEYRNLPVAGDILHKRLDIAVICDIASSLPVMRDFAAEQPIRLQQYHAHTALRRRCRAHHARGAAADDDKLRLCCFLLCSIMFFSGKFIYLSNEAISSAVKVRHFPAGRSPSSTPSRTRRAFVTLSPTAAHIFLT